MSHRSPLAAARRTGLALAAGALLISAAGAPAWAAPGDASVPASTRANVQVGGAISLTGLTTSFTLAGAPNSVVSVNDAVDFTVATNNIGGYAVTVQAADTALRPADATANPDTIPVASLRVRGTDSDAPYASLSATAPVTVHSQSTRSAVAGDTLNNDYQVSIPFVNQGVYSVTLNYVATAL